MWVGEHLRRRYATTDYAEEYENWKSRHVQPNGEGILSVIRKLPPDKLTISIS